MAKKWRTKSPFLIYTFLIFLFGAIIISAEDGGRVTLSAVGLRPGDFVWVSLTAPEADKASATLFTETVSLQLINGVWRGMLPVSYNTQAGDYVLTVKYQSGSMVSTEDMSLRVIPRDFPEDRIRVSEKMRKKSLGPANVALDTMKVKAAREAALTNPSPPMWTGAFLWPVVGRITTDFGYQRYVNDQPNGRHSGLDIAAPAGTPVKASNTGVVVLAENLHWTGQTIMIYHGMNLFSSYSHLSTMEVKPGDTVAKGSVIGAVGATGLATGPHLHLTYRLGETAVDPYIFLNKEIHP